VLMAGGSSGMPVSDCARATIPMGIATLVRPLFMGPVVGDRVLERINPFGGRPSGMYGPAFRFPPTIKWGWGWCSGG